MASKAIMSAEEHRDFGEQYDRRVLAAVAQTAEWNVLHLHGDAVFFALANEYPVAAVNWHDRRTSPTLSLGLKECNRGLIGGLDETVVLRRGNSVLVAAQAQDAVNQTAAQGLLLGAGCVIQIDTPEANIDTAIAQVRR
jgi:uroporphyrinogen decarboxylase